MIEFCQILLKNESYRKKGFIIIQSCYPGVSKKYIKHWTKASGNYSKSAQFQYLMHNFHSNRCGNRDASRYYQFYAE